MEEQIIETLKRVKNRAIGVTELYKMIYPYDKIDNQKMEELKLCLSKLQSSKDVYCTNSKKELFMISPYKVGKLSLNVHNHGFVILDDGQELYIADECLNNALNGDKVLVKLNQGEIEDGKRQEARIKEILERSTQIGETVTINRKPFAKVGNLLIKLTNCDKPLVDGMKIELNVDKVRTNDYFNGQVVSVIGHKDDPNTDIIVIMKEYGFNERFPLEVMEQVKEIPSEVSEKDITADRRDLRDKLIFTIDGDDTKDIDDAISLEKIDEQTYILGVHIADVTNYVKEGTPLDLEARQRGTSAYLADRVVPMYPHELSNGICSLNPNTDRLAVSCEMKIAIDNQGVAKILSSDIFKSIIHSRKQMTYKEVNNILEQNNPSEDYKEYASVLLEINKVALALRKMKQQRGYIEFSSVECKVKLDKDGKPIAIERRTQGAGEELIEDFMLAANEEVAEYVSNYGLNYIYRIHDVPNEDRLKEVFQIIKNYNGSVPGKINNMSPRTIQKIIENVNKSEKKEVFNNLILRCMAKAKYDVTNIGHFGIAAKKYCHFTSPIRRYPDTFDHRIIKSVIEGTYNRYTTEENLRYLEEIAINSSVREVASVECEREVNKMEFAYYMEDKIGEVYKGNVTGMTNSALYVMLKNLVEGRVSFTSMDDFYTYDPKTETVTGQRKKKVYRLGDELEVKVVNASKETREIDFEIPQARVLKRGKNGNTK